MGCCLRGTRRGRGRGEGTGKRKAARPLRGGGAVRAPHVSAQGQGAAPSPRGDRLPWWLQGGDL